MPSESSDRPSDLDRGVAFAAIFISECVLTTVVVVLRFWARWSIRKIAIDDWVMLATWVCHFVFTVMSAVLGLQGGTRHLVYLQQDPEHAIWLTKLNWVSQPSGITALGLGKVAVALLILRIQGNGVPWRKWLLHVVIWLTIIFTILTVAFTFGQCNDPTALWDPESKATAKCWKPETQKNFSTFSASWNCAVDMLLAILPVTLVKDLHMELKKKIGLCLLLGLGIFTGVCAAIKINQLVTLAARSDFTWATYQLFIWTNTEGALVIICGSIPALKPLYRLVRGEPIHSYGTGSGNQGSRGSYSKHIAAVAPRYYPAHTFEVRSSPQRSGEESGGSRSETLSDGNSETLIIKPDADRGTDQIRITQTFEVGWADDIRVNHAV
ncbi:hypothetical protein EJ05DRAFT_511646 [Pseudovirgaria hyperparasitica]|uniref:Rhodopsin domain-containing protein n=1 Tax=Pseudovirgaria hyperparasitica TaxID=470096 RepID=A0A6A6W3X7_9PEZI|nr:uncharacterized protein EJ05DRAFT_511646 [Pseudovirgaria hyperparasitica]KAF2756869.1 hypothetical protein EJ05DRAFT_511646 [Pseudovirgaria hyperparasitica]